ncbi:uncharacterized protein BDV17DRAFT_295801 [Aspergillus undulatus]|uniref:uncharacterized protein n=1 Tax=Aspergillus undulatus TaxID=1810928 RepID=UPI003CCE2E4C
MDVKEAQARMQGVTEAKFDDRMRLEDEGVEPLSEWPLDLDGWWVSDKQEPISLRRDDVKVMDEKYIDWLAEFQDEAQLRLHGASRRAHSPFTRTTIDGVVILNIHCDGSVVAPGIQKSMGEHVKIFGVSESADWTYLARLGARVALRIREWHAREIREYCRSRVDVDEDEDELWYFGWDEELGSEHDEL